MKTAMIALVMLILAAPAQAGLELRLSTELPEQLQYLHPDLRISVVNMSSDVILFPLNAHRIVLYLETEKGWQECRPVVLGRPAPLATIDWRAVGPGESVPLEVPRSRCREGSGTWFEWANQPGSHRIKAVLTSFAHQIGVPEGAFDGVLESNVLEKTIKEPTGVDAQAVAWAKGSPMNIDLLREFPTSEYAAFFIYGYAVQPVIEADPDKVRSLIGRGIYPAGASVPDRDGWRSLGSEDVAKWRIEWGQHLLREHPAFPWRNEVRVAVAVSKLALGDLEGGKEIDAVANSNDGEGARWAARFLERP